MALLGAVALFGPSPAAWAPPERVVDEDPQHVPYVAGELIITHKPEAPPEAVDAVGDTTAAAWVPATMGL